MLVWCVNSAVLAAPASAVPASAVSSCPGGPLSILSADT